MKFPAGAGRIRNFNMKAKIGRDTRCSANSGCASATTVRCFISRPTMLARCSVSPTFTRACSADRCGWRWIRRCATRRRKSASSIFRISRCAESRASIAFVQRAGNARAAVEFSEFSCDFTRMPGRMLIKEGVVRGPTIGATLDGHIDYAQDELRLRGTFVPLYGLNNMFGKIPLVGFSLVAAAMKAWSASTTRRQGRRNRRASASIRSRRWRRASCVS